MQKCSVAFTSDSPEQTRILAEQLGSLVTAPAVILLEGAVGAGKTHFARSLIQSVMEEIEDVPSPTFTLVQLYETQKGPIWHTDLYRLSAPEEIEELGLIDAFSEAICLVEWPDRLGPDAPPSALTLRFSSGTGLDDRVIAASAHQESAWPDILKELSHVQSD